MASGEGTSGPGSGVEELEILLNGEGHSVVRGATLLDLLATLGRDPRTVAVEYNGEILKRARYGEVVLAAGDRLEVVHFVQGGAPGHGSPTRELAALATAPGYLVFATRDSL